MLSVLPLRGQSTPKKYFTHKLISAHTKPIWSHWFSTGFADARKKPRRVRVGGDIICAMFFVDGFCHPFPKKSSKCLPCTSQRNFQSDTNTHVVYQPMTRGKDSTACLAGFAVFCSICAMIGAWSTVAHELPGGCSYTVRKNLWGKECYKYGSYCAPTLVSECKDISASDQSDDLKSTQAFVTLQLITTILATACPLFLDVTRRQVGCVWLFSFVCGVIAMGVAIGSANQDAFGWGFAFSIIGWMVALMIGGYSVLIGDHDKIAPGPGLD
eukprot:g12132.t1